MKKILIDSLGLVGFILIMSTLFVGLVKALALLVGVQA